MSFVVIYENAPMYKGMDEFAASAASLSQGSIVCRDQDRVFMTTPELAKAELFATEEQAHAYSRKHPTLDDAHKVARVVKCYERSQVVERVLSR